MACVLVPGRLCVPGGSAAAEGSAPSGRLEDLVRQLLQYQLALSEEETRWREQRDHLERTRDLLHKEQARLAERVAETVGDLTRLREERSQIDEQVTRNRSVLAAVADAAREGGATLLRSYDALPPPLAATLESAASRLRATIRADGVAEAVQAVTAFVADLLRLQSSVHAVEEILDIEGQGRREMEVLYLGCALGYYVAADGGRAGLLRRDGASWKATPGDEELAERVRLALDVYRKRAPARLVELPVPPAPAQAPGAGGER